MKSTRSRRSAIVGIAQIIMKQLGIIREEEMDEEGTVDKEREERKG